MKSSEAAEDSSKVKPKSSGCNEPIQVQVQDAKVEHEGAMWADGRTKEEKTRESW